MSLLYTHVAYLHDHDTATLITHLALQDMTDAAFGELAAALGLVVPWAGPEARQQAATFLRATYEDYGLGSFSAANALADLATGVHCQVLGPYAALRCWASKSYATAAGVLVQS